MIRTGRRTVRMDRHGGVFLSRALVLEMEVGNGSLVNLANDEDNPKDWYLCRTGDKNGFVLKEDRRKRKGNDCKNGNLLYGARFSCRFLCNKILDVAKMERAAVFMVSKTPVEANGTKYYKIILSNPINGKTGKQP